MTRGWAPVEYSPPEPYIASNRWMMVIGLALTFPVVNFVRPALEAGTSVFSAWVVQVGGSTGLAHYPLVYLVAALFAVLCWLLVTAVLIVTIHESVHYAIGVILGYSPRFEFHKQLFLPNPSVVVYDEGIGRGENVLMLSGPFIVLSLLCALVAWAANGFVAATAALMFAINAIPSCGDLYNVGRIAMMPRGTLFANYDGEDGLRTEFTTPKTESR